MSLTSAAILWELAFLRSPTLSISATVHCNKVKILLIDYWCNLNTAAICASSEKVTSNCHLCFRNSGQGRGIVQKGWAHILEVIPVREGEVYTNWRSSCTTETNFRPGELSAQSGKQCVKASTCFFKKRLVLLTDVIHVNKIQTSAETIATCKHMWSCKIRFLPWIKLAEGNRQSSTKKLICFYGGARSHLQLATLCSGRRGDTPPVGR